ncbi:hypothetical protein [Candidatus Carsonella ruddii]|uniref:DNA-directed RNA polymerase beta subunit n=1 Tax=Carsonella ruddii TaxID=114186 RepID=A0A1U9RRY5_CARRU|nr:hypothetical protein [Candidatus Carsonella ruddii]AQU89443.1 DNA-directed RNA polymerase beta subunit [Candidatus Carsonella ruddii]
MKNLFLIKNIFLFFSFGKDSYFSFFNLFYKKKKLIFINYNTKKNNYKIFKMIFFHFNIKNFSKNELLLRRTRFFFKKKNIFFIKNHHLIDKIEFLILKLLQKKFFSNYNNIWINKKNFLIKPFINKFIKKYINLNDNTNKFIKINRNFIRCLISKFL